MRFKPADRDSGLGGKLFYAGELDEEGQTLVVAANIAGATTLAATSDGAAHRQAMRDGVVDFAVTSLDEALRILKNHLRKREAAAVCVGLGPGAVECEMEERGVRADLSRGDLPVAPYDEAMMPQEQEETDFDLEKIPALVTWWVDSALPRDLEKLDAIAIECLDEDEWAARRWLRLAPRYLGRMAQGMRLLDINREFAARFSEHVSERIDHGDIAFAFEIQTYFRGLSDSFRFDPEKRKSAGAS